VNSGHFFNVLSLVSFSPTHFVQALLIEPVQEMDQSDNQEAKENRWHAGPFNCSVEEDGGGGTGHLRGQGPYQTFLRWKNPGLSVYEVEKVHCG
jgi:hypothetical protein